MNEKVQMLTIKEAARTVKGVSEYRIRKMCVTGAIPCFKAGNKYLINIKNLVECFN